MPTVKRQRPTRSSSNGSLKVDEALVSPEEIASIRASVEGKPQAPSSRQQAGININWARVRDQLGDPFDVERIPISRLRFMRRDPMLGFGLSFIKTPLARAKWHINAADTNGPNAQVAANVDWALRRIWSSYVFQWANILDFGFSAIAKRYEARIPTGTYIDPGQEGAEAAEQPLWSEGGIKPIVWKPFISLAPEVVEPIWTSQGDFNGIQYKQESSAGAGASTGDKNEFKIDVAHALWATHEKSANHESIFGYPRLGYGYRYWWSYWFRWGIADQAFEKKSDPGLVIRHPDGEFEISPGQFISYRDYALNMGEQLRAGATISLPSDVYMGEIDGKPSAVPLWAVEPLKDLINFDPFDKSFEYLDVMKLRSLWIPEQAFLEGKGGTSSRNVAKEMTSSFTESQSVLAAQLVETVNRWIIPQFLATNFPEFMAANGTAEMIMEGFGDQDVEARNLMFQLLGQQDFGARKLMGILDVRKIAEDAGLPLLSFKEQQEAQAEIIAEQQAANGPTEALQGIPGQNVGIVPTATGFSYIQPPPARQVVYLSDSTSQFLERLPSTQHYSDPAVRRAARELWHEWHSMYAEEYNSFAEYLASLDIIELSDEPTDNVRKLARRIVRDWETNLDRLGRVMDRTANIYKKVFNRASQIEAERAKLESVPTDEIVDFWITRHTGETIPSIEFTTREELTNFLAKRISEGVENPKTLAKEIREHFADFPGWKADRLARTEIREAYNGGTLLTAMTNGLDRVQAVDGTGDPDCENRNGEIFDIESAMAEREHPNGTLGWRILPVSLSWQYSEDVDSGESVYVPEEQCVYFSEDTTREDRNQILLWLGEDLIDDEIAAAA